MTDMTDQTDSITFLGTAGARFMVMKQLLASGGAWLNLGDTEILLDPGSGCLVRIIKKKLVPTKLSAIILSHKHLDHSGDINVMIEAMTEGGWKRRGTVFAPADALGEEAVIFEYLRHFPNNVEILSEGKSFQINDIRIDTPIRHIHPVETYGLVFRTPRHSFSWIVDTKYFEKLADHYKTDLAIFNVVMLDSGIPVDHLSLEDVRQLIIEIQPKTAILTHFGMTMWRNKPWELAKQLSSDTGVQVISAWDGMTFDLAQLDQR